MPCGVIHVLCWAELLRDVRRQQLLEHGEHGGDELHGLSDEQCSGGRRDELLLQHGLLCEPGHAYYGHVHAGPGGVVPGDDERRDDIMHDERHNDQLSGGDGLRGGDVPAFRWAEFVFKLRGWLFDGLSIDRRNGLHIVYCRHLQHRHDQHGLYDLRRQQLLEHGGHGGDKLHGLSCEQCSGGRRDELLLQHGILRECSDAL